MKTARLLFYTLFLVSSMLTVLDRLSIRVIVPFGASHVYDVDMLLIALVGVWAIAACLRGRLPHNPAYRPLYFLVVVLVLPVFTGLANGKALGTVVRDCRTPAFFLGTVAILDVIRAEADLRRLRRFIVAVGSFSLLAGYVFWLTGDRSAAPGSYRFGIGSALSLIVWLLFLAMSVVSVRGGSTVLRKLAWGCIVFGLVFVFFANDIRSVYVGMLGGLSFLGLAVTAWGRYLHVRRVVRLAAVGFALSCTLVVTVVLAVLDWERDLRAIALQDMRLQRLYSLIDPTLGGTVNVAGGSNRDDRLLGLTYGFELGTRHVGLGLGYGDNPFVDLDDTTIRNLIIRSDLERNPGNTVENLLFTHNSYGWAFGRLGLWFASAYFTLVILICCRAWTAARQTTSLTLRVTLLGTLAQVVFMLLLGFGGGAFFDYTGQGLILWLVCLAVLIRATVLADRNRDRFAGRLTAR